MRIDLRLAWLSLLALALLFSGCSRTRQRVSDNAEIPSVSIASSSAAVAGPSESNTQQTAAQGSAVVFLVPNNASIKINETIDINIQVRDVKNLYGADLRLKFDPAIVEVVDANNLIPGTQIQTGNFPDISGGKGFVAQNSVNPQDGTIGYAMTLLSPAEPVSGTGTLATIRFRGKAAGTSKIEFTSVLLSDINANQIPASTTDGTITVSSQVAGPTATPVPAPTATPVPGPTEPPPAEGCIYTVKPGDTLFSIAQRYGVTVTELAQANGISDVNQIEVDQRLVIPHCEDQGDQQPPPPPPPPSGDCVTYEVQAGDTLFSIARRYGVSMDEITQQNNLVNPSHIFVGQKLTICPDEPAGPPPSDPPGECIVYTVAPGDTLFSIAVRFQRSVQEVAQANNITNPNIIYVGQPLCIPK